jgi:membrane-bound lytic murein transglycosylase A
MGHRLVPLAFDALPGWHDDPLDGVLEALRRSRDFILSGGRYRTGSLGIETADFLEAWALLETIPSSAPERRSYLERHFTPARIEPLQGKGFVTGYYEPEMEASETKDERFLYPFYRRPDDLIETDAVDDGRTLLADGYRFARRTETGALAPYHDRQAIESGMLSGRGLEIAFAESRIDVFFAHIQGCARLRMGDGSLKRLTYAAKSGHPFTAIGRVLIEAGEFAPGSVTMDGLRAWLAGNVHRQDEILWQNRSFIFFREDLGADPAEGPVAAAKVPLTAGRSLAVDRDVHTFGTSIYVSAPGLTHLEPRGRPFRRLMVAQDTGSAIIGPARGDIFVGSGAEAGHRAGSVKHEAEMVALIPKPAAARLLS